MLALSITLIRELFAGLEMMMKRMMQDMKLELWGSSL
jgi:hypothetical protein